jgi:hypothetical protein
MYQFIIKIVLFKGVEYRSEPVRVLDMHSRIMFQIDGVGYDANTHYAISP